VAVHLASTGPFYFNIYNGPGQVLHRLVPMDGKVKPANSKGTIFTGLLPGVTYTFIVYDSILYVITKTAAQQFLPIQI
jgi:hypothetical protein